MKTGLISGLAILAIATIQFSRVQAANGQACSVEVDITDTDPKGTNVRATPDGAVIVPLKNPGILQVSAKGI